MPLPSNQHEPEADRDPRVRLVVLYGGRSPEHDVSRVSAREVVSALDPVRYEIVVVGITRDGRWLRSHEVPAALAEGRELPPALEIEGDELPPSELLARSESPTVVFPVLHGPNGEDGTVQGLLELADVAYVGTSISAQR